MVNAGDGNRSRSGSDECDPDHSGDREAQHGAHRYHRHVHHESPLERGSSWSAPISLTEGATIGASTLARLLRIVRQNAGGNMHARIIDPDTFELTLAQLTNVERFTTAHTEITHGMHEDHGRTTLILDGEACTAIVEKPAFLDMMEMPGS
jgi:hypothetical protein